MKTILLAATVVAATLGAVAPSAIAADMFSFSFNTGDVAFAYSDGYWDQSHQWHKWHNTRESREYRTRYAENYHAERHDKDRKSMGWREEHHEERALVREEERREDRREERRDEDRR